MPAPSASSSSFAAVKHELLVRYLDAWAPAALHGHRRVTYVDGHAGTGPPAQSSAIAALRVFTEFADLLAKHQLTMILSGPDEPALRALADAVRTEAGDLDGLSVEVGAGAGLDGVVAALGRTKAFGSPIFLWFDGYSEPPPALDLVSAVARAKGAEVLLAIAPSSLVPPPVAYRETLRKAGLGLVTQVELVTTSGEAQLLVFGTAAERSLERFKDELWAIDEYAGIRYRDPVDPEHTLLDISLRPNLGPLRRALAAHVLHTGQSTVAALRAHTGHETIYRSADAIRAVQALVTSGAVRREPPSGRLSAETVIRPALTVVEALDD